MSFTTRNDVARIETVVGLETSSTRCYRGVPAGEAKADLLRQVPVWVREYLIAKANGGAPEFEPDDYRMRVDKNVYGKASAGKIWYDHVSTYLMK